MALSAVLWRDDTPLRGRLTILTYGGGRAAAGTIAAPATAKPLCEASDTHLICNAN